MKTTIWNIGACAMLTAAGVCIAAGQDAVPEMLKGTGARRIESGLVGAKERKAARTFSGTPLMPIRTAASALKSSATMPKPNQPNGSLEKVVDMGSQNRRAQLTDSSKMSLSQAAGTARAESADTSVTAPISMDLLAQFIGPVYGSTLAPQQTFSWTTGTNIDRYAIWVGSCQDCNDLVNEDEGINLTRTLYMPVDGRRIYVSLFSHTGGLWYWVDYQFTAALGDQPIAAQLIAPFNGTTLGDPQTFTWQPGNHVDDYYLWIGSCFACNDLLNEDEGQNLGRATNPPEDGRTMYVRLFSSIQGNWYYYDYQFHAPAPAYTQSVIVNVTNQLGYAVDVYINGANIGSVPAFSNAGMTVNLSSLQLAFELDQPRVGAQILGDGVAGYWNTIYQPSGTYNFTIGNVVGQDVYFLPSITNQTTQALAVEVNGGLQAENRCNCNVAAYTNNVATGYYMLFSNSNVRLFYPGANYSGPYIFWGVDSNGNVSPGGQLSQYVAANSGILQLTATALP